MHECIDYLVDEGSFFEIKKLFAQEIVTGFARLDGKSVGIIANQPRVKGGVLFHDSADKAAKFINLCDSFHIPLIFLTDVPGFMIGTKVERAGIIRHGAKMLFSMSDASVPKISVIVRKAYGAGLYAMAGPAFESDCVLALPSAQIAVMGPEAAVNAVYAKKIASLPKEEQAAFIQEKRKEYAEDIDLYRLASELVVDAVIDPEVLRIELIKRMNYYNQAYQLKSKGKKHGVYPV
jgi:acetyl-CoA carboxylase carboxyltransferase component